MINSFDEIIEQAKSFPSKTIAVAPAQDTEVLVALRKAMDMNIANAVLVGDERKIVDIAGQNDISLDGFELVNIENDFEACSTAVRMVAEGRAQAVMKGHAESATILKAVLDKGNGMKPEGVLSHVTLFEIDGYDRFIYMTDPAISIAPKLEIKKHIIENAVKVAHNLGNSMPKVACLCAIEHVNEKMQATLDAELLQQMNLRGEISGCLVSGPLALDNAISPEAARQKNVTDPVAGGADILLVPFIEVGNVLYKSIVYFGRCRNHGGFVTGAKAPVIMTSRADSFETKLNAISLAMLM